MFKKLFFFSTLALAASTFYAPAQAAKNTPSTDAVTTSSCGTLAHTTHPFILILNSGDSLIDSISECAKSAKLLGASFEGLGQLHDPVLAYFSSDPNAKPKLTTFPGYYEAASLTGNITTSGKNYFTHVHGVLADSKFHAIDGHIDSAKVGMTVEISITPLAASVQRTVDAKTGFGPIITH